MTASYGPFWTTTPPWATAVFVKFHEKVNHKLQIGKVITVISIRKGKFLHDLTRTMLQTEHEKGLLWTKSVITINEHFQKNLAHSVHEKSLSEGCPAWHIELWPNAFVVKRPYQNGRLLHFSNPFMRKALRNKKQPHVIHWMMTKCVRSQTSVSKREIVAFFEYFSNQVRMTIWSLLWEKIEGLFKASQGIEIRKVSNERGLIFSPNAGFETSCALI